MAQTNHPDADRPEARPDGGQQRTPPVAGEIIHDVARSYSFGAGHLKATLERIGPAGDLTTPSLDEEDRRTADAARTALERHGTAEADAHRDTWAGEPAYSTEFQVPVDVVRVPDPAADDVLRDVWPVEIQKPNGTTETTSLDTLERPPDPSHVEVGDTFELLDGPTLVVVGRTDPDAAPDSARDGPLYQAELRHDDADVETYLYGPHNIQHGLDAGARYAGQIEVRDRQDPFWCEGCRYPHTADEEHSARFTDAPVCSSGCAQRVHTRQRKAKLADRD